MNPEPLIHWPDPLFQLLEFVGFFLAAGAIGFRLVVLRPLLGAGSEAETRSVGAAAARTAALWGLLGAVLFAILIAVGLPENAARRHLSVPDLIRGNGPLAIQVASLPLMIFGLAWARSGSTLAWRLAAAALLASSFRGAFFAQWLRLVNPVHMLAGGLWIGTLFFLVVAGMTAIARGQHAPERRSALAATMVNAFSPFALGSAAVLAGLGVVTAVRHLKRVESLWTTPYGWIFVVKLLLVSAVLGLGAWNWRRQKPRLGTEAGTLGLLATARAELTVAALVLAATALLVSVPSPK